MFKKKYINKSIFFLICIIILVISVTYAFFQSQLQGSEEGNIHISSETTDNLKFDISNNIDLNINQFNFGIGAGNLNSSATGTATLLANSSNKTANYTYYVYFKINSNDFVYTTNDSKPEIILTITNPSGQEVTSIEGLNYVTATGADGTQVKGFDITTADGLFAVAENYAISSSSSTTPTTQKWSFKATFINLDSDQENNTGKSMDAKIIMQREEYKTFASHLINEVYTTDGENGLYYHDGEISVSESVCMYEGNPVFDFDSQDVIYSNANCQEIYKLELLDGSNETIYLGSNFSDFFSNKVSVTWDDAEGICKTTTDGVEVIGWGGNPVNQDYCVGEAYQFVFVTMYLLGVSEVGNGEMVANVTTYNNDAEDYSYRYSGGGYNVANKYKDQYASIDDIVIENAILYNGTLYDGNSGFDGIKLDRVISEEYCEINNCNYMDVLDAMMNGGNDELLNDYFNYFDELVNEGKVQEGIGLSYNNSIYDPNDYENYDAAYEAAFNKAISDGYIVEGVSNYVCFGSNDTPCPDEYLYRIIGVFDEDTNGEYNVKLIKADYTTSAMLGTDSRDYHGNYLDNTSYYKGSMDTSTIATFTWNLDRDASGYGSNNWTTSELNKINLNINYINYLGSLWSNMIDDSTWYLGGMEDPNFKANYTAKDFFIGERNNTGYSNYPTRYTAKIGLMYPSDYGYAAYPDAWATNLIDYNLSTITQNNWIYMGLYEWTITTEIKHIRYQLAYGLFYYGKLGINFSQRVFDYPVRPVFYLKSNISYVDGNGTKSNPYRIS